MNGEKCTLYHGTIIVFSRNKNALGHGGNGGVYDINIIDNCFDYPIVAKFFEYDKNLNEKQKRYERFKKEIQVIKKYHDEIPGIISIIDSRCPEQVPQNKDEAWYLMPKAVSFRINSTRNLIQKLESMFELANTIEMLHKKGLAHRDIKPENILLLGNKVVLSDFGLVWTAGQERLTDAEDRIGPYKILPPELEEIDLADIDYQPSDVYLFAKVLWMVIRENNAGFRGQYNRVDRQIYLYRDNYNVTTFEPLHCLLEGATNNIASNRLTIMKCIEYIKLQIRICNGQASKDELEKLCFDELHKEFIKREVPSEYVYEDKRTIYNLLDSIIKYSRVFVKNINGNVKELRVNNLNVMSSGRATLNFFYEGRKIQEYLFEPKKLICREVNEQKKILITTSQIADYDDEYVKYNESQIGFESVNNKIVFNEEFILEVVCASNE